MYFLCVVITRQVLFFSKLHSLQSTPNHLRYDRTGITDDESERFWAAYDHYRGVKVTEKDIQVYASRFRHSKEEEADLIEYLLMKQGDITTILASIVLASDDDKDRFVAFFEKAFKAKKVAKKFKKAFDASKKSIMSVAELDAMDDAQDEVW